jgi:hypothetical protein
MPAFEEVILYDTVQLSDVCDLSIPFLLSVQIMTRQSLPLMNPVSWLGLERGYFVGLTYVRVTCVSLGAGRGSGFYMELERINSSERTSGE